MHARKNFINDDNFFFLVNFLWKSFKETIKFQDDGNFVWVRREDKRFMSRCLWQIFSGFSFSFVWYTNLSCIFNVETKRHCKFVVLNLEENLFCHRANLSNTHFMLRAFLCWLNSTLSSEKLLIRGISILSIIQTYNSSQLVSKTFPRYLNQLRITKQLLREIESTEKQR